jgi:hypothetical protein
LLAAESFRHYGDSAIYGMGEMHRLQHRGTAIVSMPATGGSAAPFKNAQGAADTIFSQGMPLVFIRLSAGGGWLRGNRSGRERFIQG